MGGQRSSLVLTIVASALISSAVLGGAIWHRRTGSSIPTPRPTGRSEQPPPPSPTPAGPASTNSKPRVITIEPPYAIVDGITVKSLQHVVRLADLVGPPREAICFDSKGHLWACGLQARAALSNLISDRAVACKVLGQDADTYVAHCQVDQADLGRRLVASGWARPTQDRVGDHDYSAELATASQAAVGLWEGGWKIRLPLPVR